MIQIAIVDDKKNIRYALQEKLQQYEDISILFTASNGIDFLEKMRTARNSIEPDVVLMDIDMPLMDGIDSVREAKLRYTHTKYIMLTIFDEDEKLFKAIKAGADGYLLKEEPVEHIKSCIEQIMHEEYAPFSPCIARKVLQLLAHSNSALQTNKVTTQSVDYNLTDREICVLEQLVDGLEYKEIATNMDISPNTIRNHISKIYKKLHVNSRFQALKITKHHNIINRFYANTFA